MVVAMVVSEEVWVWFFILLIRLSFSCRGCLYMSVVILYCLVILIVVFVFLKVV